MAETRLAIRELLRCSSCDDSSASFVTTCGRLLSVSRVVVDPFLENRYTWVEFSLKLFKFVVCQLIHCSFWHNFRGSCCTSAGRQYFIVYEFKLFRHFHVIDLED